MKKFCFIMIIFILLSGCNNESVSEPVKRGMKTDYFNLVIESDKNIYHEDDDIRVSSYLEYNGEKDIELEPRPTITIIVRNYEGGEVIEQIDFNSVETTMKEGEKFSETMNNVNLEKGKYEAFVKVTPFSVGSSQFNLSTAPIIFEVK